MPALLVALALTLHAQRLGRRVRRRRRCCSCCKDFRLLALLPVASRPSFLALAPARSDRRASTRSFDLQRSDQPRSRGDARRPARASSSDHPLTGVGPEHGRARLPAVSRRRRRSTRSTRTCTTCRCRLPPSAGCRRSASGSGSSSRWSRDCAASSARRAHEFLRRRRGARARSRDARRRACSNTTSATPSS